MESRNGSTGRTFKNDPVKVPGSVPGPVWFLRVSVKSEGVETGDVGRLKIRSTGYGEGRDRRQETDRNPPDTLSCGTGFRNLPNLFLISPKSASHGRQGRSDFGGSHTPRVGRLWWGEYRRGQVWDPT